MQFSALPSHKTCGQCTTERAASEFLPSPHTNDGLTARCKSCIFDNARRDRADREARRASQRAAEDFAPVSATRAAAGGSKRRQRANLPPSTNERTATHV